jgi:hypothetical protein
MAVGVNLLKKLYDRDQSPDTAYLEAGWLGSIVAAAVLAVFVFGGFPAYADEFDALAVYSEARPLNDRWQACAASYVRRRLRSQVSSAILARNALRSCRSQENRLRRFFVGKIGSRSAENVIAVLRLRYQADLATAIDELRTRD